MPLSKVMNNTILWFDDRVNERITMWRRVTPNHDLEKEKCKQRFELIIVHAYIILVHCRSVSVLRCVCRMERNVTAEPRANP